MRNNVRILIADDHGLFREGLQRLLTDVHPDWRIITAASHDEVHTTLEEGLRPDILVLDLRMPGADGLDAVHTLSNRWPEIPILVVSASEDVAAIRAAIEAGASGFVSKSGDGSAMLKAIRNVLKGKTVIPAGTLSAVTPRLTERQQKVLRLLAEGLSNREIAEKTHLTEGTVKQYVKIILDELGVDNRVQAAIRAREILGLNS